MLLLYNCSEYLILLGYHVIMKANRYGPVNIKATPHKANL